MMAWLFVEDIFSKKKSSILVRTKAHWETLNFIIRWAFSVLGIKIEYEKSIEEEYHKKPVIFMTTHASNLETFIMMNLYQFPLSFPAKDSLFKMPLIKWAVKAAHCIPINRKNLE